MGLFGGSKHKAPKVVQCWKDMEKGDVFYGYHNDHNTIGTFICDSVRKFDSTHFVINFTPADQSDELFIRPTIDWFEENYCIFNFWKFFIYKDQLIAYLKERNLPIKNKI